MKDYNFNDDIVTDIPDTADSNIIDTPNVQSESEEAIEELAEDTDIEQESSPLDDPLNDYEASIKQLNKEFSENYGDTIKGMLENSENYRNEPSAESTIIIEEDYEPKEVSTDTKIEIEWTEDKNKEPIDIVMDADVELVEEPTKPSLDIEWVANKDKISAENNTGNAETEIAIDGNEEELPENTSVEENTIMTLPVQTEVEGTEGDEASSGGKETVRPEEIIKSHGNKGEVESTKETTGGNEENPLDAKKMNGENEKTEGRTETPKTTLNSKGNIENKDIKDDKSKSNEDNTETITTQSGHVLKKVEVEDGSFKHAIMDGDRLLGYTWIDDEGNIKTENTELNNENKSASKEIILDEETINVLREADKDYKGKKNKYTDPSLSKAEKDVLERAYSQEIEETEKKKQTGETIENKKIIVKGVPDNKQGAYNDKWLTKNGCALTCVSGIASYLTGKDISPIYAKKYLDSNNDMAWQNGELKKDGITYDTNARFTSSMTGKQKKELIAEYVDKAKSDSNYAPPILDIAKDGVKANSHFVVVVGYKKDKEGNVVDFLINDPGSKKNKPGTSYKSKYTMNNNTFDNIRVYKKTVAK